MSRTRNRGSRGGRRVQRGRLSGERQEQQSLAEYELLHKQAHDLYTAALLEGSGLRCYPEDHGWGLLVPLPNDWLLEMTNGESDGPLFPPWHEDGKSCIFWLITPEGLYAAEEDLIFDGHPDSIPTMVVAHACRLLWRRREEIVGEIPRAQRKGLPRAEARKIKALVERGAFNQPAIEGVGGDQAKS